MKHQNPSQNAATLENAENSNGKRVYNENAGRDFKKCTRT